MLAVTELHKEHLATDKLVYLTPLELTVITSRAILTSTS